MYVFIKTTVVFRKAKRLLLFHPWHQFTRKKHIIDLQNSKRICNSFFKMKLKEKKCVRAVAKPDVTHSCVSGLLKRSLGPTPTFPRPGPKLQSRTKSALSSSFWTSSKSRLGRRDLQPRGLYSTSGKVSSTTSFQNF